MPVAVRPRPLAFLLGLAAMTGCHPPSVLGRHIIGRPASVLGRGEEEPIAVEAALGVGAHSTDWDEADPWETGPGVFPCLHGDVTAGLGNRCEVQFGLNNYPIYVLARYQLLGEERLPGVTRAFGLDASLEVGASVQFMTGTRDVHVGASVSLPLSSVTPYLGYRQHWGVWERTTDTPTGSVEEDFDQNVLFFGVFFPCHGYFGKPTGEGVALEVFRCSVPRPVPAGTQGEFSVSGFNVVIRAVVY